MQARAIAAVTAALIVGCGGGTSTDEKAVRKAVQRWSDAVFTRNNPRACAELSTKLRKQLERHLLGEGVKGSCKTWAARYVSPRHPASRPQPRVTGVEIEDGRATVKLAAPGVPDGHAELVKERGRWRVDDY